MYEIEELIDAIGVWAKACIYLAAAKAKSTDPSL